MDLRVGNSTQAPNVSLHRRTKKVKIEVSYLKISCPRDSRFPKISKHSQRFPNMFTL